MNKPEKSLETGEFYILNGVVTRLSDPESLVRLGHSVILLGEAKIGEKHVLAASESGGKTVIITRVS